MSESPKAQLDTCSTGLASRRSEHARPLKGRRERCTTTRPVALTVSVKTLDVEPAAVSKDAALRLLCRAMIRLYLHDYGDPVNGERVGVLQTID